MNKLALIPLLLIGLLVGCASASASEPITINPDIDSCARCNMGIIETEHAAQIVLKDGTPLVYDDIGCMLDDLKERDDSTEKGFVQDYLSQEWIDMEESTYVTESAVTTPMSYGIVAFKSNDDAEAFQEEHGGETYNLEDLKQLDIQNLKHADGHEHHGEKDDHHD